jgi:5-methylcytosine-specific restriction enzyme A
MASQRIAPRPKIIDPYYATQEHRAWRIEVCRRAGWRCEWIDNGQRCTKSAANGDRMAADHIEERRDGGSDLGTGMCVCGKHHTIKTNRERAMRHGL